MIDHTITTSPNRSHGRLRDVVLERSANKSTFVSSRLATIGGVTALLAVLLSLRESHAGWTFIGPTPYLSKADSPFPVDGSNPNFYLEDFEPNLNYVSGPATNGVISICLGDFSSPGARMTYGTVGGLHSVDADDGMIDGLIGGGFSASASTLFISGSSSVLLFEVQFDSAQLGYLPTAVGFVLTDGAGEGSGLGVYDRNDNGITFSTWDIDLNGTTTADDRFIGVINSDGISRIEFAKRIFHANPSAQPRIDHFQYGLLVPEPSAMDLMCAVVIFVGGFTVFGAWRRRHVLKGKLDD